MRTKFSNLKLRRSYLINLTSTFVLIREYIFEFSSKNIYFHFRYRKFMFKIKINILKKKIYTFMRLKI